MVTKSAILMRDGRMITLPRPASHHDLIWYAIHILGYTAPVGKDDTQGFEVKLPNEKYHQFCCRRTARKIAEENGQLLGRLPDVYELFSENVWEGIFDRGAWLRNNTWNLSKDCFPDIDQPVWYFEEFVGVFSGTFVGFDSEYEGHLFVCDQGGAIEATHWMPKTDIKPDSPWVNIYEESSIILEET